VSAEVLLEVCVESVPGAEAAEAGGAGRLELCSRLDVGGLTPDAALRTTVLSVTSLPVHVMIRPRAGGFVYDDAEFAAMLGQIAEAKAAGAAGLVFGVLDRDGAVDAPRLAALVAAARPASVTFHRAFDEVADPDAALEALVAADVDRVLTSGGAPTAVEGADALRRLVDRAAGRLVVMAGGGVRAHNAAGLLAATGVPELHSSTVFRTGRA
jgi:copper homeostasis protein